MLAWLNFESVKTVSRITHLSITFSIVLTIALTAYLSAYVWQDDVVLADLNGVGVPGVVTRYAVQRTCLINLLLLMAGALKNSLKMNLSQNSYFVLVSGK